MRETFFQFLLHQLRLHSNPGHTVVIWSQPNKEKNVLVRNIAFSWGRMKRERPADDIRRWAIKARLLGIPSREIAQRLDRSHATIKTYLGNCGGTVDGTYHLNVLAARALFTEQELVELGAVWNGRCWVGPGRNQTES